MVRRRLAVGGKKPGGFALVARREGWWMSVASTRHVLSRAAVDVRDLCAVTTLHIYGNYCHAIRIRCFSTLHYTRIADPSRFSGVF